MIGGEVPAANASAADILHRAAEAARLAGAGRPGIGIAWSSPGAPHTSVIVFDAQTFVYLGLRQGDRAYAEVQVAIVDHAGQRP